ncbi:MAG: hypothetical protein ABFD89_29485 [Bryobacteraceae bacterium]
MQIQNSIGGARVQEFGFDRLKIAATLYRLRIARKIPVLWIDSDIIRMEVEPGLVKRIGWPQAARIAAGEHVGNLNARARLAGAA